MAFRMVCLKVCRPEGVRAPGQPRLVLSTQACACASMSSVNSERYDNQNCVVPGLSFWTDVRGSAGSVSSSWFLRIAFHVCAQEAEEMSVELREKTKKVIFLCSTVFSSLPPPKPRD